MPKNKVFGQAGGGYVDKQIDEVLVYCYTVREKARETVEVAFYRNSKWRVAV